MGTMQLALEIDAGTGLHPDPCDSGSSGGGSTMPIGGMIFDIADVLYDGSLWRRWLVRLINRFGLQVTYSTFFDAWDCHYLVDVHTGRREFTEAFHSFLLAAGLSWAQIDEVEAASRRQRKNLELNVRPWPGVTKTLAHLAETGLPLLAWADAPYSAAKLAELIDRLGLGNQFHAVLSSFDLEAVQPQRRCYLSAIEALKLAPRDVVYVGHDAEHLAGAKNAGLRTIAFNFQCHAQADLYLTRFEDLLPLVKSWPALPNLPLP